ncbi:bifunctional transcriptional activator/DNA repair enzyme AdaA [Fictibacillus barbaricus]|uniref:AraC family transcriptional regulator of adaptative response / methylphosphotriester-DNA alkyltransferase methyltransferase n=1 Tax=Fictibacillus barbaricus TaxID=182136 RepID=A0ABU1TW60_9BACL|nr:Ada metal-binding domain-containing protein [Fictibacillus barbaricus]MDR7071420.1 AraC family transcriptional regulator of adaptative response / methylphosphotriester-DNA alkyltransferase methyltransferase [Fictibacillus barbaricus]
METINLSFDEKWDKIMECDRSYDGLFYTAVKTTKIYCRPSCRSRKPKKMNVEFYRTMSECEALGYRACKRCQPEIKDCPQMDLVRKACEYLINHSTKRVVLQDIAEHIGVSPFYLERLYKEEMKVTPREYLEKIRLDKAAYLLAATAKSNLEICFEVGFHSPSNFYKAFRKYKNCSPSEYRKNKEHQNVTN